MSAYYNEIDPFAAQWLRNLISNGHIASGYVDERDIRDVRPGDLRPYAQCHFFAGIAGWSLALRLAGWPDSRPVWTGSCPCQPFSAAGRGDGFADDRHLWPAWFHLIEKCRPATIFGEQVASPAGLEWFDLVSADLEGAGYAVGAADLRAAGVGAPHIRQRLWFVADAERGRSGARGPGKAGGWPAIEPDRYGAAGGVVLADSRRRPAREPAAAPVGYGGAPVPTSCLEHVESEQEGLPRRARQSGRPWADLDWLPCRDGKSRPVESGTFPLAHGVPGRVGKLRAYGNAIVAPLAAEFIGAFLDVEREQTMITAAAVHVTAAPQASYSDLLARKRVAFQPRGFEPPSELNPQLFPHQKALVEFALRAGASAMFADTGLGKAFSSLEWGRIIVERTNKPVLMLAPLAVGPQHQREAERFGIDAKYVRDTFEVEGPRIYITNYERLHNFVVSDFAGVILDESSVLKSFTGITTRKLISAFSSTPYRLCCTATPAPNDHTELGTHSEFLGVMRREEMLPRWFINDTADTGTWKIKGHAVSDFWRWVASWARCVSLPSDIGFSDDGYILPEITVTEHKVQADRTIDPGEELRGKFKGQHRMFRMPDTSATAIHKEKRLTIADRADLVAECIDADPNEVWLVWVDTDYEADAVRERVPDAVEVRGSVQLATKEARLDAFSRGETRVMITKPSIAGYGLNWQHCARMAFAGLSFSYENYYQAIRRCWRFGQKRQVQVHIAMADTEAAIKRVIDRKAGDHGAMKREMTKAMREAVLIQQAKVDYVPQRAVELPEWVA